MAGRGRWRTWEYALPLGAIVVYAVVESVLVQVGHPAPCLFRLLTGIPCPTCGSTRATVSLLHGDFPGALAYNPLVTCALVAAPAAAAVHVVLWRAGRSGLTAVLRRPGWAVAALVVALLANWAYVLGAERARGEIGKRNGPAAVGNARIGVRDSGLGIREGGKEVRGRREVRGGGAERAAPSREAARQETR